MSVSRMLQFILLAQNICETRVAVVFMIFYLFSDFAASKNMIAYLEELTLLK